MALLKTANDLKLLNDGAPIHGLRKFTFDNISVRPSHIDDIVASIYLELEALDGAGSGNPVVSGSVIGTDIILTLNDTSTVTIDSTDLFESETDATLTGDGSPGVPLGVANPFPGFTDLPTDYGVTLATVATTGDYGDLINTPSLITTLVGLSDTNATPVSNGFARWNGAGTSVDYPLASSIGLSEFNNDSGFITSSLYTGSGTAPGSVVVTLTDTVNFSSGLLGIDKTPNEALDVNGNAIVDGNMTINTTVDTDKTLNISTRTADTVGINLSATNVTEPLVDGINVLLTGDDNSQMYGIRSSAQATFNGNGNTEAVGVLGLADRAGRTNTGIRGEGKNGSASSYGVRGVINSGASVIAAFGTAAGNFGNASSNSPINYGVQVGNTSTSTGSTAYGVDISMFESAAVTKAVGLDISMNGSAGTQYALTAIGGNTGLGTITPAATLHAKGEDNLSTSSVAIFENQLGTEALSIKNNSDVHIDNGILRQTRGVGAVGRRLELATLPTYYTEDYYAGGFKYDMYHAGILRARIDAVGQSLLPSLSVGTVEQKSISVGTYIDMDQGDNGIQTLVTQYVSGSGFRTTYRHASSDRILLVANDDNYNVNKLSLGHSGSPLAQLDVDQSSVSAAIPVLKLDQGDVDEAFINFVGTEGVGNSIEDVGAKTLTVTKFLMVEVDGVKLRIPAGTIA